MKTFAPRRKSARALGAQRVFRSTPDRSTIRRILQPPQARDASAAAPVPDAATESYVTSLPGRGAALPETVRRHMEPRFGADLSTVRVHTDAAADRSARALDASAFTTGHHIVFRAGSYDPAGHHGKRLLAHELTHVVQQGGDGRAAAAPAQTPGAARVQRQPSNPPQTGPSSNPGPVTAPTTTPPATVPAPAPAPDPDGREAAVREAVRTVTPVNIELPRVDQTKQTATENDAAAQWLVLIAFDGEAGLNAAFDKLAPEVIKQVDADATADVAALQKAGGTPDPVQVKTANRAQFLARMRLYFNSWQAVLDHFSPSAIDRVSDGPIDLFLHRDAAAHLRRAIAALKAKGHGLPRIGEGFSLRHLYRGAIQHPGYMIHATGYAFDASAKGNPKISFASPQSRGLERHDQDLLAVTIGGAHARMNVDRPGQPNASFIEAMGKRTLQNTAAATDDTDPATVDYFKLFEQQFNQMKAGSQAFTQSLSKAHHDALLKLRDDYFKELKALAAERKKGAAADPKVIAAHEAQRRKLLAGIPPLVTEWVAAIDAEVTHELAKHPGMDKLRSPSIIAPELKGKEADVAGLGAEEARVKAGIGTARSARDAASAALKQAQARERAADQALSAAKASPQVTRRQSSGGDWSATGGSTVTNVDEAKKAAAQAHEAAKKAKQDLLAKMDALADAISKEIETRRALESSAQARDALKAELAKSDIPALRDSWGWIDRLRELRDALTKPDLTSDAGVKAFERLTTGDLSELGVNAAADNPPLLRLLDIGFFNPDGNFDLAFFEEMAHSGFWPGATWQFGGVDSMHFELVEGRDSLLNPGKK